MDHYHKVCLNRVVGILPPDIRWYCPECKIFYNETHSEIINEEQLHNINFNKKLVDKLE